ncbi:MAG: hypothetical protein PHR35_15110, partial [Kiritimatiellae bacterium]|nr:hypothetical protein [Kiritimatiellia bacterium]
KKKNAENVLAGEMILTFYKPARPENIRTVNERQDMLFGTLLDEILRKHEADTVTSQHLFNRLILEAWNTQSLAQLAMSRNDFILELQKRNWRYDGRLHVWRRGRQRGGELALDLESSQ